MRQRFSEELHGRVVGGWHLEKAHWSVSTLVPGLLSGDRSAGSGRQETL